MTFEIELNGRVRRVSIEKIGDGPGRFRVAVDGHDTIVEALRVGDYGLSLVFPDEDHAIGDVQLTPGAAPGELLAQLPGRTVRLSINGRRHRRSTADVSGASQGEQRVSAPMPGRVVRVLVAPGDEVQARQPLVVVEAMKMENELRSPRAGRIKQVAVSPGLSVDAGAMLVLIE